MAREMERPVWWEWDLDLTLDHLQEQMVRRRFSETDLRVMLEQASGFHESEEFGRWVIETKHEADPWEVVVEPQMKTRILVVITAYEVEPL